jgi:hypothetical protein
MDKILSISGAQILYNDNRSKIENVSSKVKVLDTTKVDGAFVSEDGKYLHLTCNGEDITGPLGPFSGGGGGGGGGSDNNAKLIVTNISGVLPSSIARGSSYVVTLAWSSIEDDLSTGPGSYTIKINGQIVESGNTPQGNITKDLGSYLSMGDNTIRFTITDVYGNMKTIIFTVKVVEYTLTSKFLDNLAYKGEISFAYTISGEGDKVMHFFIDGEEIGTQTHTRSGSFSYVIPSQSHGAHLFEAYFLVEIGGETIKSNVLSYDLICYEEGNDAPIITSSVRSIKEQQYFTVVIPYYVYNTVSNTSDVQLYVNDELKSTLEGVGRELQTWTFRLDKVGNYIYSIRSGSIRKDIPVEVTAVDVDVEAETQSLALYLTSRDRSNNEPMEQRTVWQYKDIKAEFHNFNWATDGWVKDSQNLSVMRVKDDARIVIPYKPFGMEHGNIHNTGKTLEFEFATSGVFDYNTSLISCISNGRGFNITAQQALFASSSSRISAQYKENEHVRVSFVINDALENRLLYCYVNGIISGIIQYSSNEIFYQDPEVNISIGSSDAIIDVYNIRIYDKALSRFQTVNNWIADMQDGAELLKQYKKNNLYNNNYEISLDMVKENLPTLPYLVVDMDSIQSKKGVPIDHLPQYKGEKLLVSGYFVDPNDEANCFSWVNGEFDVQGTSSQAYPIKNFKLKVKPSKTYGTDKQSPTDCSGFIMTNVQDSDGNLVRRSKYSLRGWEDGKEYKKPRSIETNTFVFKADYASSEGANNVELVRFYNDTCPYKTPPQKEDSRIRQGIDGFPCIWFAKKGDKLSFIGKYNFNNHKGTDEVYGFNYHGETFEETEYSNYERTVEGVPDESWEVTDNNSEIALWKRVAGTAYKELLYDNLTDNSVTYDIYLQNENLDVVKSEILTPIYEGSFVTENESYSEWVDLWHEEYSSLDDWINNLAILKIHDAGDTMEEEIQAQRNFVIEVMKDRIREVFDLRQEFVTISPEEDMLGEWGKGESVAHSFEVRFPSEWYDAHTEGFPEVVKTDRMVALQKWIVSTDTTKATNNSLEKSVTYNGVTYTNDTADYRLAKFRDEVKKYFNVEDSIFYYIFTETFLMIDSRVKNAFPSYFSVTQEVQAKDEEGNLRFKAYKDSDVIETGKEYFAQIIAEDGSVTYEPFSGTKDSPAKDSEGNPLYKRLMTEEEILDKDGWPLGRWCWLPYDMDTANGINNEGLLVFDYALEDTEALIGSTVVPVENPNGVPVYNGASSVFWNNLRKAFPNEIESQYQEIRGQGLYNYDVIEKRFEDHQNEWSASIFNEDAYYKYVKPLLETGEDRLGMCLGSKEQQRKWWMFNRFRFLDSKYVAGDALNKRISFRVNDLSGDKTVTISPYIDLYVKMKQGEQWQSKPVKVYRNKYTSIFVDVPEAGDTEAYIYSADQIKEIQGLNQNLHISTLDISPATNLQHLDVSSDDNINGNSTLVGLSLGANTLLRVLNARNCRMLGSPEAKHTTTEIKMSACEQLEEVYLEGTQILGVDLPSGGRLRKVHLPSTLTTLNLINQMKIDELKIVDNEGNTDYSNLSTLSVSKVNQMIQDWTVDVISQLNTGYIKFTDFDLTFDSLEKFNTFIDHLLKMKGPTDSQDPTKATVSGTIHLDPSLTISYERYRQIVDYYRDLTIAAQVERTVEFYNYDGTELLDTQYFTVGSKETGSVTYGGSTPTREETEDIYYRFDGWSSQPIGDSYIKDTEILNSIYSNMKVYAFFTEVPIFTINFFNYDGESILETHRLREDLGNTVTYDGEFPASPEGFDAPFEGWGSKVYIGKDLEVSEDNRTLLNVTSDMDVFAQMGWQNIENTLQVDTLPTKVYYYQKEVFDPKGMKVSVVKNLPIGEVRMETKEYSYDETPITLETRAIAITLGENNSTEVAINVAQTVELTTPPTSYWQYTNKAIDLSGGVFTLTYSDGYITEIEAMEGEYLITPEIVEEEGNHEVEILFIPSGLSCKYTLLFITEISYVLNDNSWALISGVIEAGLAPSYWHIGDEKEVDILSNMDIGINGGNFRFRIVDFDHNLEKETPLTEEGTPKYKHSMTMGLSTKKIGDGYYDVMMGITSISGQDVSNNIEVNKEILSNSWNKNGGHRQLCTVFFEKCLPQELKEVIKPVIKYQSDNSWTSWMPPEENPEAITPEGYFPSVECLGQEDTIYIPSLYELYGIDAIDMPNIRSNFTEEQLAEASRESTVCTQFAYYKDKDYSYFKRALDNNLSTEVSYSQYWTRTFIYRWALLSTFYYCFYYSALVSAEGVPYHIYGSERHYLTPYFTI